MLDNQTQPLSFGLTLDDSDFDAAVNDATRIANTFSKSLTNAFVSAAVKGKSLNDVVDTIGLTLSKLALNLALKPVGSALQGLLEPLTSGFGGGNADTSDFSSVTPFAKGGVIAAPTFFQSGGGLGLAGERGAEAILPLARGSDGSLGVRLHERAAASNVTINITTPDVDGFRRSQSEVAASLARLVARGRRST